jgi:hypothetical protein
MKVVWSDDAVMALVDLETKLARCYTAEQAAHVVDEIAPDVAGWRRERLLQALRGRADSCRARLVCEILSPSTRRHDLLVKKPYYARIGVSHHWLIDLRARHQRRYRTRTRRSYRTRLRRSYRTRLPHRAAIALGAATAAAHRTDAGSHGMRTGSHGTRIGMHGMRIDPHRTRTVGDRRRPLLDMRRVTAAGVGYTRRHGARAAGGSGRRGPGEKPAISAASARRGAWAAHGCGQPVALLPWLVS